MFLAQLLFTIIYIYILDSSVKNFYGTGADKYT